MTIPPPTPPPTATEDWEIWVGSSLALVVPASDPDKSWLTRVLTLKYRMPGVTEAHALKVFTRALRGGHLIDLPVSDIGQQTT